MAPAARLGLLLRRRELREADLDRRRPGPQFRRHLVQMDRLVEHPLLGIAAREEHEVVVLDRDRIVAWGDLRAAAGGLFAHRGGAIIRPAPSRSRQEEVVRDQGDAPLLDHPSFGCRRERRHRARRVPVRRSRVAIRVSAGPWRARRVPDRVVVLHGPPPIGERTAVRLRADVLPRGRPSERAARERLGSARPRPGALRDQRHRRSNIRVPRERSAG